MVNKTAAYTLRANKAHRSRLKEKGLLRREFFVDEKTDKLLTQKAAKLGIAKHSVLMRLDYN